MVNRKTVVKWTFDTGVFSCFNCRKPGHMLKIGENQVKWTFVSPNAYVNLIDEQFIALITKTSMIGESYG